MELSQESPQAELSIVPHQAGHRDRKGDDTAAHSGDGDRGLGDRNNRRGFNGCSRRGAAEDKAEQAITWKMAMIECSI